MLDSRRLTKGLRLGTAALIFALSFGGVTAAAPVDNISPEKRAAIDEFMKVSKVSDLSDRLMSQMLQSVEKILEAKNPGKGGAIGKILSKHFAESFAAHKDEINDIYYLVYDRHLSVEDIQAMTEFYKTPAGQRILAALPQITQESMSAGMIFGQQAAREALEKAKAELEAEGIKSPI